ncbi:MAG TPA: site-specific integrase [Stellaceae bacterium]|nr:site-specific integrase [Stellaceae bacterium]
MGAPGYITRQKLGWHFQLAVPKDLWHVVGRKVIRKTLKTRDRRLAAIKARDELALWDRRFNELRANSLSQEQRQRITDRLRVWLGGDHQHFVDNLPLLISALQKSEPTEMESWLEERRARVRELDPALDCEAAVAPYKKEGEAALRQLDDIAAAAGIRPAVRAEGVTLDGLFETWKRERAPAPQSVVECEYTVRRFRELHGRRLVAEITRQQVREFREAMLMLPTRLSNEEARLTLPEILRRYDGRDIPRASPVSARKRLGFIKALLRLAVDAGHLQEDPAAGIRIGEAAPQQRLPFNAADLEAIFHRAPFVAGGDRGSLFWLPILGLYTGARLGELLQLAPGNVHRIDGITFIDITTEGGRRLKTESSRRRVPIHPELTALGFVEWARKKDGALFADMLPEKEEAQLSRLASRDLNRMIRAAGVKEARKAFHSFRHLFKDMCREAGVEEAIGDALTGHAGGGVGRRYGAGFSLAVLADAVGKLRWPVELGHLLPTV